MCLYAYQYKNTTKTSLFNKKLEEILNDMRFKKKKISNYVLTTLSISLLRNYIWEHKTNKQTSISVKEIRQLFFFQDRKCAEPAVLQSVPK